MNKLPIYRIQLGDAEGIKIMSLVESPAVEIDFLKFAEQTPLQFSIDEEERIVFGVALRADFPIYRYDRRGEYYVVFERDTIKQLFEKFLIEGRVSEVNLEHSVKTGGVHLIESFIKDTDKGINPKGFEDVADGSWFTSYKILNDEVWEKVKNGEFKGFSVEGFFELEEEKIPKDDFESLIDELLMK